MASADVEVEIKIPLDEDSFFKVKEKLKDVAKFERKSKQKDEYFTPAHRNFVEPEFPYEWLRIGERDDKVILNYKHWHPEGARIVTHCDEFQTEVKSSDQLRKLFSSLDFKKLVTVEKEREIYIYKDEFEIVLDIVKDLGHFIEIESLKDFGGVEATRNKVFEFAESLDLDTSERDLRGYPFLVMKKDGLIKSKD